MRAQSSIEYMVVYTVAVGVILGLIATFYYLGNDPSNRIPNSCTLSSSVECLDFSLSSTELKLFLHNRESNLYDVSLNCSHDGSTSQGSTNSLIKLGEKFNITCPVDTFGISAGSKQKIDIALVYHLNYSTTRNWRFFRGTVIEKAG